MVLSINLDLESHDRCGFHVSFWRLLIFRWTLYKADTFPMHQWCTVYRDSTASKKTHWVQSNILVMIINFFSLIFTGIEIEGETVSSSQNNRTWRRGGGCTWKRARANKEGGGGQIPEILSERIFWITRKSSHLG